MKRVMLLGIFVGTTGALVVATPVALAQSASQSNSKPSATAPAPSTSATSQTRPDAKYPNPSGQDSQPSQTKPTKATPSGPTTGTPEQRGSKTADQSATAQDVAKQKAYHGNTGKKSDVGTACSTARPTANGGVDCGTGGEGATPGKVPK